MGLLDACEDEAMAIETMLHHAEMGILDHFGALPSLDECHRCGRAHDEMEKLQCLRSGEGLLCGACRRSGEAVGVLRREALDALHYYRAPGGHAPEAIAQSAARQQARRVLHNSFRLILQKETQEPRHAR